MSLKLLVVPLTTKRCHANLVAYSPEPIITSPTHKLLFLGELGGGLENSTKVPSTPEKQPNRPENPLPTNEQQSSPDGRAVSPAEAGRAPTGQNSSTAAQKEVFMQLCLLLLLMTRFTIFSVG
jgi:hypothetical protein